MLILDNVSSPISESFTATTATSLSLSPPFTDALAFLPSENSTSRLVVSAITWLFVTIKSSLSVFPTIIPEPLDCAS